MVDCYHQKSIHFIIIFIIISIIFIHYNLFGEF